MRFISFFPIPFLLSLVILTVLVLANRRRGCGYLAGLVLFYAYAVLVIFLMFFPIPYPRDWPANLSRGGIKESLSQINWIPFNYHIGGGLKADIRTGFSDVLVNFFLTIPLGMGFGFLFRPRWYLVFLAAPLVGLSFEGGQLLIKTLTGLFYHSVDASDVVTNAAGVIAGATLFLILDWGIRKLRTPSPKQAGTPVAGRNHSV